MANINLISARRAERLRLTRIAKGLFGVMIGSLAIGVFLFAFMSVKQVLLEGQIRAEQAKLDKLKPVLDEIRTAEAERNLLQPKLMTLRNAQTGTRRWWGVMDGLKHAVPEQTWLTNFLVDGGDEATGVRLNGVTSNQARVGEAMMRLTAQAQFYRKVDLKYTQASLYQGTPTVEFELSAELNPIQPEGEAAPKGDANATQAK